MSESNCVFCKIVAGQVPAEIVREAEHTIAVRDINPQAPTHILVITREHYPDAASVARANAGIMDELTREAHEAATADGVETGYRLVFNTGSGGGQTVFHVHGHVLGGRGMEWPPG